jgi:hypothetical protein
MAARPFAVLSAASAGRPPSRGPSTDSPRPGQSPRTRCASGARSPRTPQRPRHLGDRRALRQRDVSLPELSDHHLGRGRFLFEERPSGGSSRPRGPREALVGNGLDKRTTINCSQATTSENVQELSDDSHGAFIIGREHNRLEIRVDWLEGDRDMPPSTVGFARLLALIALERVALTTFWINL